MRRRVTFSRNVTLSLSLSLSLSRTCQCVRKYCSFATRRAHLHEPEEVVALLDGAPRRGVKELLVLTGERPEVNAAVGERLAKLGFEDFVAYVVWCCKRALERRLLPHTNLVSIRVSLGLMRARPCMLIATRGSPRLAADGRLDRSRRTNASTWLAVRP